MGLGQGTKELRRVDCSPEVADRDCLDLAVGNCILGQVVHTQLAERLHKKAS
jgi:hypothetical protein